MLAASELQRSYPDFVKSKRRIISRHSLKRSTYEKIRKDTVYGSRTFGISVLAALAVVFMLLAGMCVRFTLYDPLLAFLVFLGYLYRRVRVGAHHSEKIRTKSAGSNVIIVGARRSTARYRAEYEFPRDHMR